MSGDYTLVEDFISTYPETKKIIEELEIMLLPIKHYLLSLRLPNREPLILDFNLDLRELPFIKNKITFNENVGGVLSP